MKNTTKKSDIPDIGDKEAPRAPSRAKFPTQLLYLYAELDAAQQRAVQRRLKSGELHRIAAGVVTGAPLQDWSALIARERNRVLAAMFPGAIIGYSSAFKGGAPVDGVIHLNYSYYRTVELPGLKVILVKASGRAEGDQAISGRELYFPSQARMLLENLTISRGVTRKSAGEKEVEQRLATICEARGEDALNQVRDQSRALAPTLGLSREFTILDRLISGILGTHANARLKTTAGRAFAAVLPYDSGRLALFEILVNELRMQTLPQTASKTTTEKAKANFAFLESYFSNFIEGTEFDVQEAHDIVLMGKPLSSRPKDSHDILGVFRQGLEPGWRNQTLASGESVLEQLRTRHADLMRERPEVSPGDFKDRENFAGNTAFVEPRLVRGTLVEASKLLPGVPSGAARALLAMFILAEIHPFNDGNGRTARLVMNAELSAVNACRIIVPTLYREEYMDCLRLLTRERDPKPFIKAMAHIHRWTAGFDYENIADTLERMKACNAFEKSRVQFKLLMPR
jgi:hypothetical protein